jgi:hypothetical protein
MAKAISNIGSSKKVYIGINIVFVGFFCLLIVCHM